MKENAFEKSLKLTNISLLISGISIYPNDKFDKILVLLFYLNLVWLYTDVIGEFYWLIEGIQGGKSFSELTLIAPCATICLLATAKSLPLFYNRALLKEVVEKLREIHPVFEDDKVVETIEEPEVFLNEIDEKSSENIKKKIVKDSIKFLNAINLLLYSSGAVVVAAFCLMPLMVMVYEYYSEGQTELMLPFLIKYFFDPFTKARWPLVYVHQVWSTFIAFFNVVGADTFVYAFCSYTQMHFRLLCHRFQFMVSGSSQDSAERLVVLVKRHQLLIELVTHMEVLYSKSNLFNVITSSVLICLSGFNVTFLDEQGAVFAFLTFLVMSLSQISLLCLFCDMLMSSSTTVSEAIYKCRWYDADIRTKRNLLFVLSRARKPCKLTAASFADLNLSTFTTILSRSWSYFALLKTMYN